jgi:hypothetical protein
MHYKLPKTPNYTQFKPTQPKILTFQNLFLSHKTPTFIIASKAHSHPFTQANQTQSTRNQNLTKSKRKSRCANRLFFMIAGGNTAKSRLRNDKTKKFKSISWEA